MKISGKFEKFLDEKCKEKFGLGLWDFSNAYEKSMEIYSEIEKTATIDEISAYEALTNKKAFDKKNRATTNFIEFVIKRRAEL